MKQRVSKLAAGYPAAKRKYQAAGYRATKRKYQAAGYPAAKRKYQATGYPATKRKRPAKLLQITRMLQIRYRRGATDMAILTVQNLVKQYKGKGKSNLFPALNGLNFTVENGEFVAVMGPSGSGKTTLLNILSGIDTEYSGSVQLGENSLSSMSKDQLALLRRQRMGFVFQDYNLLDSLPLRDNMMLPLVLDELEPEEIEAKMADMLSLFELAEVQDKYPYTVSGGQQQRAAIARAIINGPEIVFADEPTGNLDSRSAGTVMRTLAGLNRDQQVSIVMVTHDPFAASYCSRVVFIKDGERSALRSAESWELREKPFSELFLTAWRS